MPRKEKKFHFIYKTTNLLSGKYYIGMHSTNDLNDGYMGSGKRLRYSLNKYGRENHKVEILEFFDSRKELSAREEEVVCLDELAKEECMNLIVGGEGGGDRCTMLKLYWSKTENRIKRSRYTTLMNKKLWSDKEHKKTRMGNKTFEGKQHSDATKEKMSLKKIGLYDGEKNPQYGTCWISKQGVAKKIKKEDCEEWFKKGWLLGRKN